MNDKSKPTGKEEIFDVFRSDGDHDVSAENYRLKKQIQSHTTSGPIEKNHFTDSKASPAGNRLEPHALILSGTDGVSNAADQAPDSTATTNQTTIRLETFRIGMQERLAAMQVAQQKAKDKLSDLEDQSQGTDKLPKS
jgi:hypothetical protein